MRSDPRPYPKGLRQDLFGDPRASMTKAQIRQLIAYIERRRRRGGPGDAPVPVRPDHPNSLSGGAAAAVEPDGA